MLTPDARWQLPADFLARVRIRPAEEGGRPHTAYNGIRWDFSYRAVDGTMEPEVYIIWPLFCDAAGEPLGQNAPLPLGQWLPARMYILTQDLRATVHRPRLCTGLCFYCHEGVRAGAEGVVTDLSALHA